MKSETNKKKVLIGMSGGVDSSVAAALLLEQGYEVTGAFMKQWSDTKEVSGVCSWKVDRREAMRVAAKLGIPLLTLDFEKEYMAWVMEYMFKEYEAGRTPNPDVMCNKFIKFGSWLEKAKEMGFDYLATGHYARIKREIPNSKLQIPSKNVTRLLEAVDENKDQTYFLHQLTQEQLQHVLFPIGEYTKDEIRKMAKTFELPNAEREESMGICFVGEVPMKQFLQQKIGPKPGDIITSEGKKVGEHDGLSFYTIGQRHGFQQAGGGRPLFVVAKNFENNKLIVGYEDDPLLYRKEIEVTDVSWTVEEPEFPLECLVRLRHRQALQNAEMRNRKLETGKNIVTVKLEQSQKAVTPGQFAVFYKDGECLGGGIIY